AVAPESMQLAPEMPRIEMALPQTLIGRSRPSTAWLPERTLPAPEVWTPSEAMAGEPANRTPPATAMAPAARTFFSMCFSSGNRSQGAPNGLNWLFAFLWTRTVSDHHSAILSDAV